METPPAALESERPDAARARALGAKVLQESRTVLIEPEAMEVLTAFGIRWGRAFRVVTAPRSLSGPSVERRAA